MSLTPAPSESPWQPSRPPAAFRCPSQRGKRYRHELLVEMSVRGPRSPGSQWAKVVRCELERTLECLLGPDAPLPQLLEEAQLRALDAWPPPADQPLPVWVRCIACAVALGHLTERNASNSSERQAARPGSVREVLSHLYTRLGTMSPHEQVAFALLELNGTPVSEAAVVLRVPPATVVQSVARARRQLLFAARRDRLLLRYLCIARRLRAMSQRFVAAPAPLAAE